MLFRNVFTEEIEALFSLTCVMQMDFVRDQMSRLLLAVGKNVLLDPEAIIMWKRKFSQDSVQQ